MGGVSNSKVTHHLQRIQDLGNSTWHWTSPILKDSSRIEQRITAWWLSPTPLKNMKVSWDYLIPNTWKNKWSKPPTSIGMGDILQCVAIKEFSKDHNFTISHVCWWPPKIHDTVWAITLKQPRLDFRNLADFFPGFGWSPILKQYTPWLWLTVRHGIDGP